MLAHAVRQGAALSRRPSPIGHHRAAEDATVTAMTTVPGADGYRSGPFSMDEPTERQRLRLLERYRDEATMAAITSLDPRPDWRTLEIGAGTGSIATWMASRCPTGEVTAIDIDTRGLRGPQPNNLVVLRADVTGHDFATAAFDLVHARAVLCHIPARDEVVANTYDWLVPGGWLLAEDVYTLPVGSSPYPAMNRYAAAAQHCARLRGADMQWGNKLPGLMARRGFTGITVDTRARMLGVGGVADELWRINLAQAGTRLVNEGLLSASDLDACTALLDDPGFLDIRYFDIAVRGRRPAN